MRRKAVAVLAVAWPLSGAFFAGCFGDSSSSSPGPDAAARDASAPDAASTDSPSSPEASDAGLDAAPDAAPACNLAKPFGAPVPISELDTANSEVNLRLSADYLTAWFDSDRAGSVGRTDLWTASRPNLTSPFANIRNVPNINTALDEDTATVSGDGLSILFTRDTTGTFNWELFRATRASTSVDFSNPLLMAPLNTQDNEDPFLREDGRVVYFGSDRAGSWDFYRASANGATFDPPTAVTELNSSAIEDTIVVTPDDLTVYFGTNRDGDGGVKGDYDIWSATRSSTSGPFSNIVLVSELSTAADDRPSFVTRDGCTLYFYSTRPGGLGSWDVYVATKPR